MAKEQRAIMIKDDFEEFTVGGRTFKGFGKGVFDPLNKEGWRAVSMSMIDISNGRTQLMMIIERDV
jgi:hypothetical protein